MSVPRNQTPVTSDGFLQELFSLSEDIAKCHGALSKLTRHLDEPIIVTGSIAASWHLIKHGRPGKRGRLNDIDIVVEGLFSLRTSLSQDFLINHFHPRRGAGRILIQLVDEEYGARVDVFTPTTITLTKRLIDFAIGEVSCSIVSAEDIAAKLLTVIHSAANGEPIEPKYVESFHLLSTVADLDILREVWREYRKEGQPVDFEEAADAVQRSITAHPGLLQAGHYSQDVDRTCPWCCESKLFPLAPRSKIYGILGYV
jgi:hypothetical protein